MKEAIIGLIGVVIGALIGLFTTHLQNKHNVNMFIMQKRIDAYLPIIKLYFNSSLNSEEITFLNVVDEFQQLSPDVLLFGSNQVKNQLEKVKDAVLKIRINEAKTELNAVDRIHEMFEFVELIELMRSELCIQ